MIKLYTVFILLISLIITSCIKDYEDKIIGNWQLEDVDKVGFGNSSSNLPFRDGNFSFSNNSQLQYTTLSGAIFQGSWQLRNENSYDGSNQTLFVTAVNFNTQEIRSEHFSELHFTSRNRFKAFVTSGNDKYVFYFRRQ